MSAAEKLKMLGAPSDDPFWMQEEQNGWVIDIISALPQIVAVVKAAERETEYDCINGIGHYELTERGGGDLGRALAALDEALGDVT